MRPCGYSLPEMELEALRGGSECNPPLRPHEAKTQFKSTLKKQSKPNGRTIANKLGVSVEMADLLELKYLAPITSHTKELANRDPQGSPVTVPGRPRRETRR